MFPGQLLDLWEEHIVMHDTEMNICMISARIKISAKVNLSIQTFENKIQIVPETKQMRNNQ